MSLKLNVYLFPTSTFHKHKISRSTTGLKFLQKATKGFNLAKTTEELHKYALYVVIKAPAEGTAGENAFQLGIRVRPNSVLGDIVKQFRQPDGSPPAFALKHVESGVFPEDSASVAPTIGLGAAMSFSGAKGRAASLADTGGDRGWSSTPNLDSLQHGGRQSMDPRLLPPHQATHAASFLGVPSGSAAHSDSSFAGRSSVPAPQAFALPSPLPRGVILDDDRAYPMCARCKVVISVQQDDHASTQDVSVPMELPAKLRVPVIDPASLDYSFQVEKRILASIETERSSRVNRLSVGRSAPMAASARQSSPQPHRASPAPTRPSASPSLVAAPPNSSAYDVNTVLAHPMKTAMYNNLVQQGHPPEAIAAGLDVWGPNEQQVIQFARGFYALQQLGFSASMCRTSLANCANDQQRATAYARRLQRLCGMGHPATDVVVAIDVYPSDDAMAEKFLDGLRTLRAMGFPQDKVQHALMASGCDTEQALATLGVQ
mmetsp:Transcript_18840/g.56487  ORF Transcript_18840/g.56487 Transcript_18840/m.56487 type:complete len:488 (-) Transcript_18840:12-1475(-)